MDHQTFAQQLGNYGEFLGAIAVVATLFYLSRQISQNSNALDAGNQQASTSLVNEGNLFFSRVMSQLACDGELASIYHRALSGDPLDGAETVRFVAFANTFFSLLESIYFQTKGELLDEFTPVKGKQIVGQFFPYWRQLFATEPVRGWWTSWGPALFVEDFVQAINDVLAENDALPVTS